ncbi:UNVERIFIED_CONTAM: hypothetical protein FKN15_027964 [Acipenser sinensis]
MNGQPEIDADNKKKYKNLKRKLKFLVYEQECFQEELRRAQRKLLKVSRDKSFLLDRLLQYEHVDDDSSDSDATASSENSDGEAQRATENAGVKKCKSSPHLPGTPSPSANTLSLLPRGGYNPLQTGTSAPYLNTTMNGQPEIEADYKKKYKNLKRKLKFLVYEQECFQEELRRAQRKLLKVSRDKSFLLDRLLQYEHVDDDSSDSDATASSENSDGEAQRATENAGVKKCKSSPHLPGTPSPSSNTLSLLPRGGYNPLQTGTSAPYLNTEEERDVQYASLDLKKTSKRKKKKKVIQNDVTYAAVKR